jgi:hypothetical protein
MGTAIDRHAAMRGTVKDIPRSTDDLLKNESDNPTDVLRSQATKPYLRDFDVKAISST